VRERKLVITARFAKDAEDAKINIYSLQLSGRQWISSHSRCKRGGKTIRHKFFQDIVDNSDELLPKGLSHFAFRRLSKKQNKKKSLRS